MNIRKALNEGFESYQRGDINQAEDVCKNILKKKPNNADALHLLGMIYSQRSDYDLAIKYIQRALGIDPSFAEALNNLGNIFQKMNRFDEAISSYQKAVKLNPNLDQTYLNLGITLHDAGKIDDAVECYRRVIELKPDHFGAYNNLGLALQKMGKIDEAITCYQNALEINPQCAEALNNLGLLMKEAGYFDEAIANYQKALQIKSDYTDALNNLGTAWDVKGHLSQAISCYRKTIEIDPYYVHAYNNLGSALKDSGDLREAERYFRHALHIQSDYIAAQSNMLLTMNYDSRYTAETVFSEHIQFAERFEKPLTADQVPHLNEPAPDRRLRIGYVSPDFKRHSVSYFIEPVLLSHNHDNYEIYCYADVLVPDDVTRRLHGYADNWLNIVGKSDKDVAALIRAHKIDILVDLAGHTAKNRMLAFARKPAPIQISWIGYPATTGLSVMDYKIVDHYTNPPGMTEHLYSENLIRMPKSFLCYLPERDNPDVVPLPALKSGYVTFGSFNTFAKVTPEIMGLWSNILKSVPGSCLLMKAKSLSDKSIRDFIIDLFKQKGIDSERIELLGWEPLLKSHLETYSRIDIALDTFPYHGTTTTCEALYMGVPVITLEGNTHASRVGVSLLSNVDLVELIGSTREEYIARAVDLAHDLEKLQSLRQRLRDMMLQSPLTNRESFTLILEKYYRNIWMNWCNE
jgi:predicted O-linked N-acetylglucosamine transferase (SPINDLY family)